MDKYQMTFHTWNNIADLYQEKFMDLDLYNDSYDVFCQEIKTVEATILEIGCGPGNITKYLLAKRPDFRLKGIDIAPNMITLAQKNNPTADFEVMDVRNVHQLTNKYDGIMMGFCLPYLAMEDLKKLIRDSYALLNDGGIWYLSTIEGDYAQSGVETGSSGNSTYVYYYSKEALQTLFDAHHFRQIRLFRKSFTKNDGTTQTHLIFILKK